MIKIIIWHIRNVCETESLGDLWQKVNGEVIKPNDIFALCAPIKSTSTINGGISEWGGDSIGIGRRAKSHIMSSGVPPEKPNTVPFGWYFHHEISRFMFPTSWAGWKGCNLPRGLGVCVCCAEGASRKEWHRMEKAHISLPPMELHSSCLIHTLFVLWDQLIFLLPFYPSIHLHSGVEWLNLPQLQHHPCLSPDFNLGISHLDLLTILFLLCYTPTPQKHQTCAY